MNRSAWLSLVMLTAACGGKPEVAVIEVVEEPLKDCSLSVTLSGTLEGTIAEEASMGCANFKSVDSGIDNVFLLSHGVAQFEMVIDDVHEGETGTDYPARIYLHDVMSRRWGTPPDTCWVDVTENTYESTEQTEIGDVRAWLVSGTGYCSSEAIPTGQGAHGLVMISAFDFRLPSSWHD